MTVGKSPQRTDRSDHPEVALPTIYDVAGRAGVSIATVSRVLQRTNATAPATRDRVLQAVSDLGYVPRRAARSLAYRRAEAHGLVLGAVEGPYYSELLAGHEHAASVGGQSVVLMIADGRSGKDKMVREMAGRVDGLVIGPSSLDQDTIEAVSRTVPVVLLARDPVAGCDLILTANERSAVEMTSHLLDHGRRNLLFVGDPNGSRDVRERYDGFRQALLAAELPVPPPLTVPQTEQGGLRAAAEIIEASSDLDGVVCANDELALAVLVQLQRHGIAVPEQIAVTGWDDVHAARYVSPSLTTVRQPIRTMGEMAVRRLDNRLTGSPVHQEPLVLETELITRRSCGCPDPDLLFTGVAVATAG